MDEVRPHGELPIKGKLDGGYVRKRLEDMGLRGQFAEAIRPAEEVLHRRALGLMDQDGIPDGASQFGEGSGARDHQVVDDLTGVCQESEPRHHIDRFLSDETRDVVPCGLRTQSCRHGENLDGRTRVVDQRVQDPPVKSRQLVFQWRSGDSLPYRRMTEELLEGRDRLLHIVGHTSTVTPPSTFHATQATSGPPNARIASSRLHSPPKETSRSSRPKTAGLIDTQYPCRIPRSSRRRSRSRTAGAERDTFRPRAW